MSGSYLRRLKTFDTVTPFPLETRAAGTYSEEFLIEGNSILSTLFVESCDVGASILVEYWDSTTGTEVGERYDLIAHRVLTDSGIDRITVTRIHNKPNARVTVIGGNVRFGIYITVVASMASDLDAALVFDASQFVELRSKGIPVAGMDDTLGKLRFLRVDADGNLMVAGTSQSSAVTCNHSIVGIEASPLANIEYTVLDYTVPTNGTFLWLDGKGHSGTIARWRVEIDGSLFMLAGDNCFADDVPLLVKNGVRLSSGQRITVKGTITHPRGIAAPLYAMLYGNLEGV